MITANEYQEKCKSTAIYPKRDAIAYLSLGLVSEAGEVAGKVKKHIRDGTESNVASEIGEIGKYDDRLSMIIKYLERRQPNEAEEKKESKSK